MSGKGTVPGRTPLTQEQIALVFHHAFGDQIKVISIKEISGGTVNETYEVDLSELGQVVLRVAPPESDQQEDELHLMRREHNVRPYFSAVSDLMPAVLVVDFSHQVIDRDYMIQEFLPGERWSDVEEQLEPGEKIALWRQCGEVTRRIHDTTGDSFGYPPPGRQFSRWSEVILDRFDRISGQMSAKALSIESFHNIEEITRTHHERLDRGMNPHLLHGDLWTFNLLVDRESFPPTITGLLDADRAWWGDPLADWIMFLLEIRRGLPEWQANLAAFAESYGSTGKGLDEQFRLTIYQAMHIGEAAMWSLRHGLPEDLERARRDLDTTAENLSGLLS